MATRSATATIAGYIYQFDYTIKCLFDLSKDNDYIFIENIEDVDIHSATEDTAIQCKYYAGTEYKHSVIARPIRLMLNHYFNVKNGTAQSINYKLYGFYSSGQEKLVTPITIEFLKKHFLTYTENGTKQNHHDNLCLNDDDLGEFLKKLAININAEDDSAQFQDILSKLKQLFNCDDFEAEHYYYNNALKIVSHIAKQSDINERKIIKSDFVKQINKKEILFSKWFIQLKGEKYYYTELRKKYFSPVNANERFFLIDAPNSYSKSDLKDVILTISRKWTKQPSKLDINLFCPYIYIRNISEDHMIELMQELQKDDFLFIDGYQHKGANFSVQWITQKINYNNQIKLKLIDTLDNLNLILQTKGSVQEVYQFYLSQSFFELENQYTKHIKIQVKDLQSIKEIV